MRTSISAQNAFEELRLRLRIEPDIVGVFDFLQRMPASRRSKCARELITLGFLYQRMVSNAGSVNSVGPVSQDGPDQAPESKGTKEKAAPFPEGQGDDIDAVDAFGGVFGSMSSKVRHPRK